MKLTVRNTTDRDIGVMLTTTKVVVGPDGSVDFDESDLEVVLT